MTTAQKCEWGGQFGTDYTKRQTLTIESRVAMFRKVWHSVWPRPATIIECGAGNGDNLRALRQVGWGRTQLTGIEVNPDAYNLLKEVADEALLASATNFRPTKTWDLVLTRGFLIHVHPRDLPGIYDSIHKAAAKHILICEYYNPRPVEIQYRGEWGRLWKRDFAGEMLDRFPNLKLIDYGFVYHRDPVAPQDDVTWFLMEKTQ